MSFTFETHALPLLLEMADDPLADGFPIKQRAVGLGIARDDDEADRLIELLRSAGYITFKGSQNGSGAWMVLFDVRLTPRALQQLDLWPANDERGLYLLRRIADAMDGAAVELEADGDDATEPAGRLRSAASAVRGVAREFGTEVTAKFLSNLATGG